MTTALTSFASNLRRPVAAPRARVRFSVPARHNPRLQTLVERIDADEELRQLWRSADVNAGARLGLGDHGETHVHIVANAGLRLLRLLLDAGHRSGLVDGHGLARPDAEVLVVLAAALHDLGLSVHPDDRGALGLVLAHARATSLLDGLYPVRERTALVGEALHAISAHHHERRALTLEAGVLEIADVLDLSKGRLAGLEAAEGAVDAITITRGVERPVRIDLRLSHRAALPAVTTRLTARLDTSALVTALEFSAAVPGEPPHAFCIGD